MKLYFESTQLFGPRVDNSRINKSIKTESFPNIWKLSSKNEW